MRKLLDPIPQALDTLRRDNPQFTFEMPSPDGIYAQFKPGGDWHVIVTTTCFGQVLITDPGERTLAFTDPMYQFMYHGGPNPTAH